jgi:hypothetical protein
MNSLIENERKLSEMDYKNMIREFRLQEKIEKFSDEKV